MIRQTFEYDSRIYETILRTITRLLTFRIMFRLIDSHKRDKFIESHAESTPNLKRRHYIELSLHCKYISP